MRRLATWPFVLHSTLPGYRAPLYQVDSPASVNTLVVAYAPLSPETPVLKIEIKRPQFGQAFPADAYTQNVNGTYVTFGTVPQGWVLTWEDNTASYYATVGSETLSADGLRTYAESLAPQIVP